MIDMYVIIATYNSGRTLRECLNSISNQKGVKVGVLLVDGGSVDKTIDIADEFPELVKIVARARDKGIYDAWNKAINYLGDYDGWLLFLGSDDELASDDVLLKSLDYLKGDNYIYYGDINIMDDSGDIIEHRSVSEEEANKKIERKMPIPHPSTFHNMKMFKDFGLFDSSYKIAGDYEFLLRCRSKFIIKKMENLTVANMRNSGMSNTPANKILIAREVYRAQLVNKAKPSRLNAYRKIAKYKIRRLISLYLTEERIIAINSYLRKNKR